MSRPEEGNGKTQISIDELAQYVTKLTPEAAQMASRVKEAVVHYPIPFCKNNVNIIDTPGLNDEAAMTDVTFSILPSVDAVILVVVPESPFSVTEGTFLKKLLGEELEFDLDRMLFVVTAMDRVRTQENKQRVLGLISDRIVQILGEHAKEKFERDAEKVQEFLDQVGEPKVFGVSGYDALEAKQTNKSDLFLSSGFEHFEKALEVFLTEKRGAITLKSTSQYTVKCADRLFKTLDQHGQQLDVKANDFKVAVDGAHNSFKALKEERSSVLKRLDEKASAAREKLRKLTVTFADELVGAAEKEIEKTDFTNAMLNQSSVGALGSALEGWINKSVKPNKKMRFTDGWKKTLNEAREKITDSGSKAAKKMRGKGAEIEELIQRITKAVRWKGSSLLDSFQDEVQSALEESVSGVNTFSHSIQHASELVQNEMSRFSEEGTASSDNSGSALPSRSIALNTLEELDFGSLISYLKLSALDDAAYDSLKSIGEASVSAFRELKDQFSSGGGLSGSRISSQMGDKRLEAFKERFKESIAKEISSEVRRVNMTNKIDEKISSAFEEVETLAEEQTDALMGGLWSTINEFDDSRDQDVILKKRDKESLSSLQGEVLEIKAHAVGVIDRLSKLVGD